jgi:hypothetical protein
MAQIPGTPKLESRNPPKCPGSGLPGLWEGITPRPDLGSRRGLNRSCSPRRDLSNGVSHFQIGHRERVDSRLLVVGSQTANLTPGPSFAHNLGCRCPNRECEGIFDIYVSRPFRWHQEHPNERCSGLPNRLLSFRKSQRTPIPTFSKCWASPPHLAKVGLRHQRSPRISNRLSKPNLIMLIHCFNVAKIVSHVSQFLVQGIQGDSFQGLQCNYQDKGDYGRPCTTQINA